MQSLTKKFPHWVCSHPELHYCLLLLEGGAAVITLHYYIPSSNLLFLTSNICPVRVSDHEINFGTDIGEYGKWFYKYFKTRHLFSFSSYATLKHLTIT